MSKNVHIIVKANTNERITDAKVTTANFRDICRAYLTDPVHFGERLHVVRNPNENGEGQVIFDVTSIRYSSGQVRMTLFTEWERQQKLHAQTAAKHAEREAAKAAKTQPVIEEPKAEEPVKKSKKQVKKAAKAASK